MYLLLLGSLVGAIGAVGIVWYYIEWDQLRREPNLSLQVFYDACGAYSRAKLGLLKFICIFAAGCGMLIASLAF